MSLVIPAQHLQRNILHHNSLQKNKMPAQLKLMYSYRCRRKLGS